jgi:hypothetical protein
LHYRNIAQSNQSLANVAGLETWAKPIFDLAFCLDPLKPLISLTQTFAARASD